MKYPEEIKNPSLKSVIIFWLFALLLIITVITIISKV